MIETIWQNEEHENFPHEEEVQYIVRASDSPRPQEEWRIVSPVANDRAYTGYRVPGNPTREEAIQFAAEYTLLHPGYAVRVERVTFLPEPSDDLITMSRKEAKGHLLSEALKRLDREAEILRQKYAPAKWEEEEEESETGRV